MNLEKNNNICFDLSLVEKFSSSNLFDKIHLLELKTINNMSVGMSWVKNKEIDAVLVGGTAVVSYLQKGRDLTPDIDYLVSNMNDVKRKLSSENITYSDLVAPNGRYLGITVPIFNMDFLDVSSAHSGNIELNKLILSTRKKSIIGGNSIDIISPELLAILKLDLGRTKDINDGFALLMSGNVDRDIYISYAKKLKNTLNDYESIIGYCDLIL